MEDAAYPTVTTDLPLDRYIALQNQRLPRMAQQLALGLRRPVRSVAAAYTATTGDFLILVDTTAAGVTVTLPPASLARDVELNIKKINAGANNVTIDGNGTETIDGAATVVFNTQWQSYRIVSNGTAWYVV